MLSGIAAIGCAPASGSFFPLGITTVHCDAADVAGNVASTSFTVYVAPGPLDSIRVEGPHVVSAQTQASYALSGRDEWGNAVVLATPSKTITAPIASGPFDVCHAETLIEGCLRVRSARGLVVTVEVDDARLPTAAAGVPGRALVRTLQGTPAAGAHVALQVNSTVPSSLTPGPLRNTEGETGADGALWFTLPPAGSLPGDHRVIATASFFVNDGQAQDGYAVATGV